MVNTNLVDLNRDKPAPFSSEKMVDFFEYTKQENFFFKEEFNYYEGCVPIDKMVGTSQRHKVREWGDALLYMKRIKQRLNCLKENPDYYRDQDKKDHITYIKVNENYFADDGVHRTVIAKFLLHFNSEFFGDKPVLGTVGIRELALDHSFMRLKSEIDKLVSRNSNLQIQQWSYKTSGNEWRIANKVNTLCVVDKKKEILHFNLSELEDLANALKKPNFLKKLNRDRYHSIV